MPRYHINPKTGNPGVCKAMTTCPFGDLETEHYSSKEEARETFEAIMAARGKPIVVPPSPYTFSYSSPTYYVEYEYDSYHCSDPSYCANSGDYCRDKVYEGLRVEQVSEEELFTYTASLIGKETPEELKEILRNHPVDFLDGSNWEAYGEGGYYGEEAEIEPPPELISAVKQWFYDQEGVIDSAKILPYLRGKGFATKGMDPLKAVKEHLAAENHGKRNKEVEAAKGIKISSIALKNIIASNSHHYASATPAAPTPISEAGTKQSIGGVLIEVGPNKYKLLDGYHRLKHLKEHTSRRNYNYIVLTQKASPYSHYSM